MPRYHVVAEAVQFYSAKVEAADAQEAAELTGELTEHDFE